MSILWIETYLRFFGGFGWQPKTSSGPGAFLQVPRITSLAGVWKLHFAFIFFPEQASTAS